MRAAAHTGIQLLGGQPRTTHPGLQFCLPNGEWVELDSSFKDSLLINIGDMLSYLLGGKIQPTLHRVVNGGKELESVHRYCIVHFFHCDLAKQLQPLGNNEPIIAGDWLKDRLAKLGR
jgi:isopenicillin N synthase-like dioxygenase